MVGTFVSPDWKLLCLIRADLDTNWMFLYLPPHVCHASACSASVNQYLMSPYFEVAWCLQNYDGDRGIY